MAREAATAEILRVIQTSRTDAKPVFEAIAQAALKLCDATSSTLHTYDGKLLHIGALASTTPEGAETLRAVFPRPASRDNGVTRAVLTRDIVHIPDILKDPDYATTESAMAASFRSVLAVPLMQNGLPIGAVSVGRPAAGPYPASQIALLQTFADQAVIAIENVRLFTELEKRNTDLTQSLEQQIASGEILRVISQSHVEVQPVFESIVQSSRALCHASFSGVYLVEGDMLGLAASDGMTRKELAQFSKGYPRKLGPDTVSGRAALECRVVQTPDLMTDPQYAGAPGTHVGARTVLGVPLVRNGRAIGAIGVWRAEVELFSERQIALLQTFADQAVIAIENVRLFTELGSRNRDLTEALEQQTATSDILRVISQSPTDVQPVFDTIAAAALNLCDASNVNVFTFDGELLHLAALVNLSPTGAEALRRIWPQPPNRGMAAARAVLTGKMVEIPDVLEDPEFSARDAAVIGNFRSILAVPLAREGRPVGAIAVGRPVPGAFSDSQAALLQTFADQAVIAIENVRLFTELGSRNRELTEALEQQTATSDILRVISQSPTDVQPVFDTIAAAALKLCAAASAIVTRVDGDFVSLVASANLTADGAEAIRAAFPMPIGRGNTSARVILEGAVVEIPDVLTEPDYKIATLAILGGFRCALGIPLMREGRPIGTITVGKPEPGRFSGSQIALLKTFADQAVIAIENVRLFTELERRNTDLTEALEQQTATSDILRVISQSPTDVQPVFDTIAAAAQILCRATSGNLFTYDGELVHVGALINVNPNGVDAMRALFPRPASRDLAATRAVLTADVVAIPDVLDDPDITSTDVVIAGGFRSVLAVPLIRDSSPIGAIAVGRPEPVPYSETQIALLKTFADQAVIAIENVRLFTELEKRNTDLTEALEQQTATSEILRVISQSQTDVQPVFDTIAAAANTLCRAQFANVFTYDGQLIHVAATNSSYEYESRLRTFFPRPPGRATTITRAIATGEVCAVVDVMEDADYEIVEMSLMGGFRSVLAVPLLRDGTPIGGIAVGRPDPGAFPESQVALLQTFADQAVIAIENVRLFKELEARTAQLTRSVGELRALGDVGQAVSSTLDLETVLSTIVSRAVQLTGMDGGSIFEYDETREEFHLHTTDRLPKSIVDAMRANPIAKGEGAMGLLKVGGGPVEIFDLLDQASYQSRVRNVLVRNGYRSILAVPLTRDDQLLGGLAVNRKTPGAFDPQVIELLKTFATQSAIAIQNARLFREIEIKSRELETASRHKSEFLANMSHELRTPLNAIIGFSEVLSERLFGDMNEKQTEYVGDIADSGRHLLELINDILDLSKIEAGRMELDSSDVDLAKTIGQTLTLVRERAERRGILLESAMDPDVGVLQADERKVKQVLLNLLSNALKFTPEGGSIRVAATNYDDRVEVSVRDTGVGIAPEDQEAVFEEFRQVGASAARTEGTGLGLAISRKFIELHGGRLWLESEPGKGSTFTFSLPRR